MGDVQPHVAQVGGGLVVMYHYVLPSAPPEPSGVRPLLAREFEAQLEAISERYEIVHPEAFLGRVSGKAGGRPPCLLTFDDGTADHATVATPILARRGLSGVFFVLSGPATEGLMPLTHLAHWALSAGDEAVWAAIEREAADSGVSAGDPAEAARMYHYEPTLRGRIKYAVNVAMPGEVAERALARLLRERGETTQGLARRWFVSAEQVRAMHAAGMVIGLHGHSHRSLQQMGEGVGEEMARCAAFVERCTGEKATWWACPFGGTGAAPALHEAMGRAMAASGVTAGVSTVARQVRAGDALTALPRVDCVKLPPRRAWE